MKTTNESLRPARSWRIAAISRSCASPRTRTSFTSRRLSVSSVASSITRAGGFVAGRPVAVGGDRPELELEDPLLGLVRPEDDLARREREQLTPLGRRRGEDELEPLRERGRLGIGVVRARMEQVDEAPSLDLAGEELCRAPRSRPDDCAVGADDDDDLAHVVEELLQALVGGGEALFAVVDRGAHVVEGAGEAADLVVGADLDGDLGVATLDPADRAEQPLDRREDLRRRAIKMRSASVPLAIARQSQKSRCRVWAKVAFSAASEKRMNVIPTGWPRRFLTGRATSTASSATESDALG